MEGIRQYLLSVILAAIFCALTVNILGKKGVYTAVVKLLTGLFMAVVVIAPWRKLQITDLSGYLDSLNFEASEIVQEGEDMAAEATASIIKDNIEAYILDKAFSLGLDIQVNVVLTETSPFAPDSVTVSGSVSPYAKQKLQKIISDELGIPEEKQSWT